MVTKHIVWSEISHYDSSSNDHEHHFSPRCIIPLCLSICWLLLNLLSSLSEDTCKHSQITHIVKLLQSCKCSHRTKKTTTTTTWSNLIHTHGVGSLCRPKVTKGSLQLIFCLQIPDIAFTRVKRKWDGGRGGVRIPKTSNRFPESLLRIAFLFASQNLLGFFKCCF